MCVCSRVGTSECDVSLHAVVAQTALLRHPPVHQCSDLGSPVLLWVLVAQQAVLQVPATLTVS